MQAAKHLDLIWVGICSKNSFCLRAVQVNFRRVQSMREQPTSPLVALSIRPPHSALPQVSLSFQRPVIDVIEYGSVPSEIYCPTTVLLLVSFFGTADTQLAILVAPHIPWIGQGGGVLLLCYSMIWVIAIFIINVWEQITLSFGRLMTIILVYGSFH